MQSHCQLSYACLNGRDGVDFLSDVVAQLNSVSLQPDVHCMFSQIETLVKLLLTIVVGHMQNALKFGS